jgi:hypothetical protein
MISQEHEEEVIELKLKANATEELNVVESQYTKIAQAAFDAAKNKNLGDIITYSFAIMISLLNTCWYLIRCCHLSLMFNYVICLLFY